MTVDDEEGARAAAVHLLELGHRSFLVISLGPFPSPAGDPWSVRARRMSGYSSALAAAGIILADREVEIAPASVEGGTEAFERAWASGLRPTAVLAMSDAMAVGALSAARRLGLDVPEDVSVVGFDDIELSQYTDPPMTTVHQPTRYKGEEAIRLLLEGPVRRDDGRSVRRLLETRLVIRGSTRAPVGVATVRGGRRRAGRGGPAGTDPIGTGARVTEESMQQT